MMNEILMYVVVGVFTIFIFELVYISKKMVDSQ